MGERLKEGNKTDCVVLRVAVTNGSFENVQNKGRMTEVRRNNNI